MARLEEGYEPPNALCWAAGEFRIWLDPAQFVPFLEECFMQRLTLHWDKATGEVHNAPFVTIDAPGWGDTEYIEDLVNMPETPAGRKANIFRDLVLHLVGTLRHERNVTLRGAPYDWRMVPGSDWRSRFRRLVEETHQSVGRKVMLLTHCSGGLVLLRFLRTMSAEWQQKHLEGWIAISTPFGGAQTALMSVVSGNNEGIITLDNGAFSQVERTWSTLWWHLPSKELAGLPLVTAPDRNYTSADYVDLFSKLKVDMYNLHQKWGPQPDSLEPVAVPMYCFISSGVETLERLHYASPELTGEPEKVYSTAGDGSVGDASLGLCSRLRPAKIQHFHGVEHLKMLHDPGVMEAITSILLAPSSSKVTIPAFEAPSVSWSHSRSAWAMAMGVLLFAAGAVGIGYAAVRNSKSCNHLFKPREIARGSNEQEYPSSSRGASRPMSARNSSREDGTSSLGASTAFAPSGLSRELEPRPHDIGPRQCRGDTGILDGFMSCLGTARSETSSAPTTPHETKGSYAPLTLHVHCACHPGCRRAGAQTTESEIIDY